MLFITKFREPWTHTFTVMGVQRERIGVALVCLCAHRTSDVSHVHCWEASAAVGVMMSIRLPHLSLLMTNQRSRTSRRWTLTITFWTSSKFAFESQKRSIPCSTGRIRLNMRRNGCARRQRLWTSILTLTIDPSASGVSPAFILLIDVN